MQHRGGTVRKRSLFWFIPSKVWRNGTIGRPLEGRRTIGVTDALSSDDPYLLHWHHMILLFGKLRRGKYVMLRHGTLYSLFVASFVVSLCGCGNVTAARDAAKATQSAAQMKQLGLGLVNYRDTYKKWPENFDKIASFTEGKEGLAKLLVNPITGDNPGYEYVKPTDKDADLTKTIVIYQLRDGKRDESLQVLYGNASVRMPGE